jgi:hypothetical protein
MGGSGSSRWKDHQRAPLVEEARPLDVASLEPALRNDQATGILQWTDPGTEELTAEFVFALGPVSEAGTRRLVIEPTSGGRRQVVSLEPVRLGWHSGWLFRCPADCGRRARKLYALPRWMVFSCRKCGGLVYRSTQTHDSRLDLARRDPEGFVASRAKAPKTLRSQMVTASLALEAQDPYRPGRSWGRRSTTTWSRMVAQWRQDFIDRWGFPPEDAGRVARDD